MILSRGVGQYTASEPHTFKGSRLYRPDGLHRGVINSPGRGSFDISFTFAVFAGISNAVASVERPLISFTSGTTWGNDTIRERMELLRIYFGTAYGALVDEVFCLAGSMGSLNVINYMRAYPSRVKAAFLQVPVTDLIYTHDNNVGGWASEIEAAYGGSAGWAAAKIAHSPQANLAEIAALGIPMIVLASTDDPYIPFATAQAFATAVGAEFVSMGAVSHDPSQYAPLNDTVLEFFHANA